MITIQPLQPEDWQLWRELRLQALAEAPYAFGSTLAEWQGPGDNEGRWRRRWEGVPFNVIALLDGQAAGMIGATAPDAAGRSELLSLWVAPWARGRGVGDALVRSVLGFAAGRQARSVLLRVREANGPAIALYQRNGFHDTGEVETETDGPQREKVLLCPI